MVHKDGWSHHPGRWEAVGERLVSQGAEEPRWVRERETDRHTMQRKWVVERKGKREREGKGDEKREAEREKRERERERGGGEEKKGEATSSGERQKGERELRLEVEGRST